MRDLLTVIRSRNLVLLLSARIISSGGDWLYQIALSIAIYRYSHGASFFVGLLWIVRLVPNLFLGPFSGNLADRLGYRRAMVIADIARGVLVAVLALILGVSSSTWPIIYPFVFLVTSLDSLFRPASVGLIPSLVRTKEERLAANAAVIQVLALAGIIGSAIGGVVAGLGYIVPLLIAESITFGISALSLSFIRPHAPLPAGEGGETEVEEEEVVGKGIIAGFRLVASRPLLVFAASVMALPELASGAVVVWIVPFSVHSLHLGNAGVGYLYSALGLGALLGGVVAALIGGTVRLDHLLAGSVVLSGVTLALFGLSSVAVAALLFILLVGLAETLEYAAYETLLQQAVPENAIGRASGTMDSFLFNSMLIGNLISGLLAAWIGLTVSIFGLGIVTALGAVAAYLNLRLKSAGQPDAALLAEVPAFAHVPVAVREWATRRMLREQFPPGAVVIRQGDEGDKFYTIARGVAQVEVMAEGEVMTRELGPGTFFGEIALLRNVPRTATVRALKPLTVYALSREDFHELQERASEFTESLLETVSARLAEESSFKLALAMRT